MNILITGVCGFVGFSLAEELLKLNNNIIGVDNINNYYSKVLKKKRLSILKKKKNFQFILCDINNHKKITNKTKKINIDIIFNFAAQAGVRYAAKNPKSYYHSNVDGFKNLIKFVKHKNPKKFIFASSSSVYGDAKKYPVKENNRLKPKNLYAKTKKFNEYYAEKKFKSTNIKVIGLRLFTIYGEWGRPDMLILKFLKLANQNKQFELNCEGNMYRDFTYIKSAIKMIKPLIKLKIKKRYQIFNICSSKPVKVNDIVESLKEITKFKKIKNISMNKHEVYKTYGSNQKILRKINLKNSFLPINKGVKKTFNWFLKYKKII
ncbi:GDP-mannose 4,6-dehydratase [Candidatus Pelagibacter ubique]|uniref:NAD-dependent epimerase/dehydratase family protein n=1 Tax=Pelagibacter ubique TaxID=198252 RepID=UPI0003FF185A